ncbi:unnamed protein product [Arabis nemorensis]|uniref:Uncharacterized protein n=1 Tax=Arabis nemorensis TaxID=586526 RepID=A0A565ANN6_9BRAS|nr:unnamed protein product [Arabis nemorensis]
MRPPRRVVRDWPRMIAAARADSVDALNDQPGRRTEHSRNFIVTKWSACATREVLPREPAEHYSPLFPTTSEETEEDPEEDPMAESPAHVPKPVSEPEEDPEEYPMEESPARNLEPTQVPAGILNSPVLIEILSDNEGSEGPILVESPIRMPRLYGHDPIVQEQTRSLQQSLTRQAHEVPVDPVHCWNSYWSSYLNLDISAAEESHNAPVVNY